MLPQIRKRNLATIILAKRKPDGSIEEKPEDPKASEGLASAFSDVVKAIHAGDMDAGASALKSFFEICDSQPHEEGEHLDGEIK